VHFRYAAQAQAGAGGGYGAELQGLSSPASTPRELQLSAECHAVTLLVVEDDTAGILMDSHAVSTHENDCKVDGAVVYVPGCVANMTLRLASIPYGDVHVDLKSGNVKEVRLSSTQCVFEGLGECVRGKGCRFPKEEEQVVKEDGTTTTTTLPVPRNANLRQWNEGVLIEVIAVDNVEVVPNFMHASRLRSQSPPPFISLLDEGEGGGGGRGEVRGGG
jgi:hypothetical protein